MPHHSTQYLSTHCKTLVPSISVPSLSKAPHPIHSNTPRSRNLHFIYALVPLPKHLPTTLSAHSLLQSIRKQTVLATVPLPSLPTRRTCRLRPPNAPALAQRDRAAACCCFPPAHVRRRPPISLRCPPAPFRVRPVYAGCVRGERLARSCIGACYALAACGRRTIDRGTDRIASDDTGPRGSSRIEKNALVAIGGVRGAAGLLGTTT
jgi:hypothetical protein